MKRRRAKPAKASDRTAGLVLDTGALLALERRNLRLITDLKLAGELGVPIRIPAGSLAQSWRGGQRSASIARLLKQPCVVVPITQAAAKEIGEYLASLPLVETKKPDVVDAHVAFVARSTKSLVWTSEPDDIARYGVDGDFIRKV